MQVLPTLCHSLTRGWRTEGGSPQFSARRHHPAPASRCGCLGTKLFGRRLCRLGSLTPGAAQFLSRMIEAQLAFLDHGGIGSGTRGAACRQGVGEISRPLVTDGDSYRMKQALAKGEIKINNHQETPEDWGLSPGHQRGPRIGH